ncbi:hypothetical protein POD33_29940 [Streptomyces moderatus]|nr:hypothetical protein POD33_29940 [Streptomyces moderatus]
MSQFSDGAARQVKAEQDHVTAVYDLLDVHVGDARGELTAVLESPVHSAGSGREVYERDLAAARWTREVRRLEAAETGLVSGRIDGAEGDALHIGRLGG